MNFNVRISELSSVEWEEEIERRSKDKVIGNGGRVGHREKDGTF